MDLTQMSPSAAGFRRLFYDAKRFFYLMVPRSWKADESARLHQESVEAMNLNCS